MKRAWRVAPTIASIAALALSGCVTFERYGMKVTYDPEGGYGTVGYVYHNLQSTDESPEAQQADFRSLIEAWKEDRFLVEQLHEEQLYVRSRELRIESGALTGRQTALFKELADVDIELGPGDSLSWSPGKDFEVLRTNGSLLGSPDSAKVWWPPGTTRFEVEVRLKEFEPHSDFVKAFRKWMKEH